MTIDRILDAGQSIEWDVVTQYRVFDRHKEPIGGALVGEDQLRDWLDYLHDEWTDKMWAAALRAEMRGKKVPRDIREALGRRPFLVMARRIGPWRYLEIPPAGVARHPSDDGADQLVNPAAILNQLLPRLEAPDTEGEDWDT